MTKAANIFIIATLLITSALANITVYKCVHDGELCMTKTCCEVIDKTKSCCSEDDCKEPAFKNVCCDEVQIVQSFIFTDNGQKTAPAVNLDTYYPDIVDLSCESAKVSLNDIIRGPPLPVSEIKPPAPSLFIKNCSFLC